MFAVHYTVDNGRQAYIIPFVSRSSADDFSRTAADLAILNGRLWTGNNSQPFAEALACREERIVAVGSNDDVKNLIDSKTRVIDLQGGRLLGQRSPILTQGRPPRGRPYMA